MTSGTDSRRKASAILAALAACLAGCGGGTLVRNDCGPGSGGPQRMVGLAPGVPLAVRGDLRLPPGAYVCPPIADEDGSPRGVIEIADVTGAVIDLTGVTLSGAPAGTGLDQCSGYGILLRGCDRVTIRGGTIGGYKACIVAEDCHALVIEGTRFDGWYGMRLRSNAVAEDPTDWLYPHENDAGEWLERYGGAISLTDCSGATVRGCRGRHGQNGILLTRSGGARIYDNDFSFLSGWGLALYRSSKNVVGKNRFDYCVRGYSHGAYWRGQDSAGILMFERCSDNVLAYNSATHSGDGVFLFGGQDTVAGRAFERGEPEAGGSDRNVWYRNDFSYAVANAIEATFSTGNWAIENRLVGSHQHGVWGGYSAEMMILGNEIADTLGGGVSIEHGQECAIAENRIAGNDIGVELWWDEDPDLVGGPFGQHRDTRSRDHWIEGNALEDNVQDVVLKRTEGIVFRENTYASPGAGDALEVAMKVSDLVDAADPSADADVRPWMAGTDGSRPSGFVERSSLRRAGERPPAGLARARAWEPPEIPGTQVTLASERGARQGLDTIVMGEFGPWDFESGEPRPAARAPGGLLAGATWDATWFSWRGAVDPRAAFGDIDAWRALRFQPLVRKAVPIFTSPWSDAETRAKVGEERFGLIASTQVRVGAAGRYRLSVISDDGVRVQIGERTVLENWTWHPPTRDEVELDLAAGTHRILLEYFQIDGAAALAIDLDPVDPG